MLDRINAAQTAQDSKGPGLDLQICLGRPILNPGKRIIIPGLQIGLPMATLTNLHWETCFQPGIENYNPRVENWLPVATLEVPNVTNQL